jgi:amino acid permease
MSQQGSSEIIALTMPENSAENDVLPEPLHQDQSLRLQGSEDEASSSISSSSAPGAALTFGHFLGAVANLCSATLGAGILGLPFALYQAGLIFGSLLLLLSGWATATSINLLVQACEKYQLSTYEQVVEKGLGRKARQVVEISILLFSGGTAVAYVIAVGDIMERVEDLSSAHKRVAMVLVWGMAMLPLSCLKKMKSLQCASTVGIASIGILLVAATVHLLHPTDDDGSGLLSIQSLEPFFGPADGGWLSVLRACPIVFFAFSCQVNVCQIYDELPTPRGEERLRSMGWVTWSAVGLCGLLYSSVSLVTLMDFGNDVTPNILSCYTLSSKESLLHVAFLAMALAVVMAFPLNIFPARVSLIQMWASSKPSAEQVLLSDNDEGVRQPLLTNKDSNGGYNSGEEMERGCPEDHLLQPVPSQESTLSDDTNVAADQQEDEDFDLGQHIFVTLTVAGFALGLALVIPNISVVFGLLGGTTSSLLGFVVPGLLGLEMDRSNTSAWILVVAGTLIGVLTTGVTVYTTIHDML